MGMLSIKNAAAGEAEETVVAASPKKGNWEDVYAERKQWEVGPIHVEAVMDRDQEGDKVDTRIRMEITLRPDLPTVQRARLMQIAGMCPVHRTLQNPISMEIGEAAKP